MNLLLETLDLFVQRGDLPLKRLFRVISFSPGRLEGALQLSNLLLQAFVLSDLVVEFLLQLALSRLQLCFELCDLDLESAALLLRQTELLLDSLRCLLLLFDLPHQIGDLVIQVTSRHSILLDHAVQTIDLCVQANDRVVALSYDLIPLSDHLLLGNALVAQSLNLEVSLREHLLQLADFVIHICSESLNLISGFLLLRFPG